jgi:2'-5' RNA ligase
MARVRTFIAVPVSHDLSPRIQELIRDLSRGVEGVKWVSPDKLHFTLKFLGDVEDTDLHEVCTAIAAAVAESGPFDVLVTGAGAFPNGRRPRTVWVGVTAGEEELAAVQRRVDKALRKLGYPRESRKFTPHVTIGRIRQGNPTLTRLAEHLQEHAATELGTMPVDEVLVFSSDLLPEGPEYHVLGRAPLSG